MRLLDQSLHGLKGIWRRSVWISRPSSCRSYGISSLQFSGFNFYCCSYLANGSRYRFILYWIPFPSRDAYISYTNAIKHMNTLMNSIDLEPRSGGMRINTRLTIFNSPFKLCDSRVAPRRIHRNNFPSPFRTES